MNDKDASETVDDGVLFDLLAQGYEGLDFDNVDIASEGHTQSRHIGIGFSGPVDYVGGHLIKKS